MKNRVNGVCDGGGNGDGDGDDVDVVYRDVVIIGKSDS